MSGKLYQRMSSYESTEIQYMNRIKKLLIVNFINE